MKRDSDYAHWPREASFDGAELTSSVATRAILFSCELGTSNIKLATDNLKGTPGSASARTTDRRLLASARADFATRAGGVLFPCVGTLSTSALGLQH